MYDRAKIKRNLPVPYSHATPGIQTPNTKDVGPKRIVATASGSVGTKKRQGEQNLLILHRKKPYLGPGVGVRRKHPPVAASAAAQVPALLLEM